MNPKAPQKRRVQINRPAPHQMKTPPIREGGSPCARSTIIVQQYNSSAFNATTPNQRRGGYKLPLGVEASLDPILNPAKRPNVDTAEQTTMEWNRGHPDSAVAAAAAAAAEGWLEKDDEVVGPEIVRLGFSTCCPRAICDRNESSSLAEQTWLGFGGKRLSRCFERF